MEILGIVLLVAVVGYMLIGTDVTGSAGIAAPIMTTRLTATQIAAYAQAAGFDGEDLIIAVAVALGESSGNPVARNQNPPREDSIGLWQINVLAHPEYSYEFLIDPQNNANAAYNVYLAAGGSFQPWGAFTNNSYAKYLDTADQAVNG
jgi:hypothetical protein